MTTIDGTALLCRSQEIGNIPAQLIFLWEQLNEPYGVKDLNSHFIYANRAYLNLLALPQKFDIVGRLDNELPAPTAEFAAKFQLHDRLVEREQQRKSSLEIHPFGYEQILTPYFFDKTPFYNNEGDVVGTQFHARLAEHLPMDFYSTINNKTSTSLVLSQPDKLFTNSEWKVVFFLLQSRSQKEIANHLKLSVGYINNRVSVIFGKCGVSNRRQLIEYCRGNGWHNYFPGSYLSHRHELIR
ncbi:helix-turn-helix transcriptional regulator [Kluyvera intermedia]|uniref:helix-turn-helix transcriptional regulator n=1 Tax=Kluyvera intermedia TaxID=61648 RepID=UPI0035261328